jgi:site-specific DNA-methyltransferase (adenine-specific)
VRVWHQGEKNDWGTTKEVLDPLETFGGIELDPAANTRSLVKCRQGIYLPDDGLEKSWADLILKPDWRDLLVGRPIVQMKPQGLIFLNPPYGRQVVKWLRKCVEEASKGCEIVALVAARTETKWFQDNIYETGNAVCYWKGRIRFIDLSTGLQGDPAFFPSALAYWGPRAQLFADAYADKGHIEVLR